MLLWIKKKLAHLTKKPSGFLLVDILFPTPFALWRICEITSFIQKKNADILVFKVDSHAGINYKIEYEKMSFIQGFEEYNIIIFDPRYNFLNKYNKKINGTRWNNAFPASYLFTKKDYFNIRGYQFVYHIFLMCYKSFNSSINFPKDRQAIHLYPGGGFLGAESLMGVSRKTKIISTHPKTSHELRQLNHTNFIECFGGSYLCENEKTAPPKPINNETLTVCFASMGDGKEKGAGFFQQIAETYISRHPLSNIEFISIGNSKFPDCIEPFPPMPIHDLMQLYRDRVDIIISIDTGKAYNGWPLGGEAALSGALLVTTDIHDANSHYNLPEGAICIFTTENLDQVLTLIHELDQDRIELQRRANMCQQSMIDFYRYEAQQGRIFSYIDPP